MHVDYLRSVLAAGGVPVMLSSLIGPALAAESLAGCHGLVLTGGEDLDPEHYGEQAGPRVKQVDSSRDRFELALFDQARSRGIPVLAICRGFQLANVALGGSLWQDLAQGEVTNHNHDAGETWQTRNHQVHLTPGSLVAEALGTTEVHANSFHHQGIRELGRELTVVAQAHDGVVEAAESARENWWFVGVQWHPENFWHENGPDLRLFAALIRAASERLTLAHGQ